MHWPVRAGAGLRDPAATGRLVTSEDRKSGGRDVREPGGWAPRQTLTTRPSAELVDAAAVDRVLVHGSPPGEGRDLDLLVRSSSEAAIASGLLDAGYQRDGHRFVRFRRGTCEQVELYPAEWWGLPPDELDALFDEAVPLSGYSHLVRPSPEHTLLILGRRVVEGVGYLADDKRHYVEWAVERDPKVWDHAADRSEAWNGLRSLELLERLVGHGFVPTTVRARIIDDRLQASGRSPLRSHVETARQLVPRRKRPVVVALSGLDGSGKSTQARLLVDTFNRIGIDCAIEWAKLGEDRRLWALRRTGARLVRPLVRARRRSGASTGPEGALPPDPARDVRNLRTSSTLLTTAWAAVVMASNIWTYRRNVARYRGRATFLVYDRYVLDSAVHLRWRYGLRGRTATCFTDALVRWSPRPIRAFYLEIPPDSAQHRKMEDHLEDLERHAEYYSAEVHGPAGSGVIVLDGTRSIEALAAHVADEVWGALAERDRHRHRRLLRLVGSA